MQGRLPPGAPVLSGIGSLPTSLLRCMLRSAGTTVTLTAASACSSRRLANKGRTSQQFMPASVASNPTPLPHGRRVRLTMTTTQRTTRFSAPQIVTRWASFHPPHYSTQMYDPVCGMDNVTYSNECFLRKAECSSRMVIQVWAGGQCFCIKTVKGSTHRLLHTGCGRRSQFGQRSHSYRVRCCVPLCFQTCLRVRWCVQSSHAKNTL